VTLMHILPHPAYSRNSPERWFHVSYPFSLAGTFLNALRQQTSRRTGCSMDQLKLVSAWERGRLSSAPLSVAVEGLLLQVPLTAIIRQAVHAGTPLGVSYTGSASSTSSPLGLHSDMAYKSPLMLTLHTALQTQQTATF
jgi:hypothetical protein